MTTGALIFAFNNEQIDYLAMARWSARNINRHLGIPTAIVTDQPFVELDYERCIVVACPPKDNARWFADLQGSVTWYNSNRVDAYSLSPWDQTLVLDSDYVVASDQLKPLLNSAQDFLAHRWAYDITGLQNFEGLNYFGTYHMPMWWATVMMFRRSTQAELIFKAMQMIRENWTHYRNLYGNPSSTYRNDHALSIALGIVNGHTLNHAGIPWNLASLTPEHTLTQTAQDQYRIEYVTSDKKKKWIAINNVDFHAMGKGHLGEIIANNS
jgi:hypothetical protein